VVGDDDSDHQRDRGIQPVPAARGQNDRADGGDTCRRSRVCDGVEQDRRNGQIPFLAAPFILISPETEPRRA
jgi:hypothetical protein